MGLKVGEEPPLEAEGHQLAEALHAVHDLRVQIAEVGPQCIALPGGATPQHQWRTGNQKGERQKRERQGPVHHSEGHERQERHHDGYDEGSDGVGIEPLGCFDVGHGRRRHVARPSLDQVPGGEPFECGVEMTAKLGEDAVGQVMCDPHLRPGHHGPQDDGDPQRNRGRPKVGGARAGCDLADHVGAQRGGSNRGALVEDARHDREGHEAEVPPDHPEELPEPGRESGRLLSALGGRGHRVGHRRHETPSRCARTSCA